MYSMPVIGEPHASHGLIGPRFSVSLASSPFGSSPVASLCRTIAPRSRGWSGVDGACPGGGTCSLISLTQMTAPGPRTGRLVARYPRARGSSRAASTEAGHALSLSAGLRASGRSRNATAIENRIPSADKTDGASSRRSHSPRRGPRARGALPAGGRTTLRRKNTSDGRCRMPPAGADQRFAGITRWHRGHERVGSSRPCASVQRAGVIIGATRRCWPGRRRPPGRAGKRVPARAWSRVYRIRGARRSGPVRSLGSCAPGVTLPLAGPLPALLRCQRRAAPGAPRGPELCLRLQRGCVDVPRDGHALLAGAGGRPGGCGVTAPCRVPGKSPQGMWGCARPWCYRPRARKRRCPAHPHVSPRVLGAGSASARR